MKLTGNESCLKSGNLTFIFKQLLRSWLEYLLSRNVLFVFLIKSINFVRVTFRVWQSLTSEQK